MPTKEWCWSPEVVKSKELILPLSLWWKSILAIPLILAQWYWFALMSAMSLKVIIPYMLK